MLVGIYQRCIKYPIFFVECGRRISKLTEQYRKQFCAVRLVMSVVLRGFNDAILPAQAAPKRGGRRKCFGTDIILPVSTLRIMIWEERPCLILLEFSSIFLEALRRTTSSLSGGSTSSMNPEPSEFACGIRTLTPETVTC